LHGGSYLQPLKTRFWLPLVVVAGRVRTSKERADMGIAANVEPRPEPNTAAIPSKLAGRFWRLFAVLIDGIVVTVVMLPIYWYFHVWHYAWAGVRPPLRIVVISQVIGLATFAAVNFRLLEKRGQTVGKWYVGIAIVGLDGAKKRAAHLLVYRFVPALLFPEVPYLGWLFALVDTLAIFGRERRCLHDRIAGTKVIEVESP
jgi:uncharacterized RDD family membrane protein YckC